LETAHLICEQHLSAFFVFRNSKPLLIPWRISPVDQLMMNCCSCMDFTSKPPLVTITQVYFWDHLFDIVSVFKRIHIMHSSCFLREDEHFWLLTSP
jgi:hypothetical protein